eukprot:m51a1_g3044 putative C-tail anchored protein (975) ;mRNA; f:936419-939682
MRVPRFLPVLAALSALAAAAVPAWSAGCKKGLATELASDAVLAALRPNFWLNGLVLPNASVTVSSPVFIPVVDTPADLAAAGGAHSVAAAPAVLAIVSPNDVASPVAPSDAAAQYRALLAANVTAPIVAPVVEYCAGCSDPAQFLAGFAAACPSCASAYGVVTSACNVTELAAQVQGVAALGKPLWVFFGCAHAASQAAFLHDAQDYLERFSLVARYAFDGEIGLLVRADGTATELGDLFVEERLPASCAVTGAPAAGCASHWSSAQCEADAQCLWCGSEGCSNASEGDCVISGCDGSRYRLGAVAVSYDEDVLCPVTRLPATSFEYASLFAGSSDYATVLRDLCVVVDVASNATTTALDAYSVALDVNVYAADYTVPSLPVPGVLLSTRSYPAVPLWIEKGVTKLALSGAGVTELVVTPPVFISYSWKNVVGSLWTSTNITSSLMAVEANRSCGDGIAQRPEEQCDSGAHCLPNCTCPAGLFPDGRLFNSSCVGCAVVDLHGHHFAAPPELQVAATAQTTFDITVSLPQTNPARWGAFLEVVDAHDGSEVNRARWGRTLLEDNCRLTATLPGVSVEELMTTHPRVYAQGDYYHIQFAVLVEWKETVELSRRDAAPTAVRIMNARLTFELHVGRVLTASTNVTVLSSEVLWAYVRRSFLSLDGPLPRFDLDIETLAREDSVSIVQGSFAPASWTGAIGGINNATLLRNISRTGSHQIWRVSVLLANFSICTLGSGQGFVMDYVLAGPTIAPARYQLRFSLQTTDSWCAVNTTTVGLEGSQSTYGDNTFAGTGVTRFLRGNRVYVRVSVQSSGIDIAIKNVVPDLVRISGSGVAGGSAIVTAASEYAYAVEKTCTGPDGCYSFLLPPSLIGDNALMTIETQVVVTVDNGRKRGARDAYEVVEVLEVSHAVSSIAIDEGIDEEDPEERPSLIVRYKVGPGVVAAVAVLASVAVIALGVTVYALRKRRSYDSLPVPN